MASSVQTTYSDTAGVAYPGMLFDNAPSRRASVENADAAAMPSGTFAAKLAGSAELKARTLALASDVIAGLILHTHARNNVSGQAGYEVGGEMPVLEEGAAYALAEVAMVVGDPVYVRLVANGAGKLQVGAIRKDNDAGTCMLVKGARVVAGGGTVNPPAIYFSKAVQEMAGDQVEFSLDHAGAIAATTTLGIILTKADRQMIIDEVVYDNPTGFVQDAVNDWSVEIKRGATSIAKWDTTTGQQGTIAADTFVTLVNAALANRVVPPGTRLDLVLTKLNAPANLTAGRVVVRGHYV